MSEREDVEPRTRAALRAWLRKHHQQEEGVWLVLSKKSGGPVALAYAEAVEELLCFGWVDSKPNTLDEHRYRLLIAPRKVKSSWSRVNKERVARLVGRGLMMPAGLAAVDAARKNGAWDKLNDVEAGVIPDDLLKALKAHPPARKNFEAFPPSVRRGILEWIGAAKKPETREKRVLETASLARENVRANQWRP